MPCGSWGAHSTADTRRGAISYSTPLGTVASKSANVGRVASRQRMTRISCPSTCSPHHSGTARLPLESDLPNRVPDPRRNALATRAPTGSAGGGESCGSGTLPEYRRTLRSPNLPTRFRQVAGSGSGCRACRCPPGESRVPFSVLTPSVAQPTHCAAWPRLTTSRAVAGREPRLAPQEPAFYRPPRRRSSRQQVLCSTNQLLLPAARRGVHNHGCPFSPPACSGGQTAETPCLF
jgi:hypothetical protein